MLGFASARNEAIKSIMNDEIAEDCVRRSTSQHLLCMKTADNLPVPLLGSFSTWSCRTGSSLLTNRRLVSSVQWSDIRVPFQIQLNKNKIATIISF